MTKEDALVRTGLIDPRTQIFLLFLLPVVLSTGIPDDITALLLISAAIPFSISLIYRRFVAAFVYSVLYALSYIITVYVSPLALPLFRTLIYTCGGFFVISMPSIMMFYFLVKHTKVAEVNAAMEKIHLTPKISIPIMVIIRFIPTLMRESASINAAMKMRGVRFGGGKPAKIVEYRMIPLLISSVKIGDELSMAAVTKGMGAPVKRTPIYDIRFNVIDYILFGVGILCIILFALTKAGVIR